MVRLNRINGEPIVVNTDLIESLEVTPEVVVVLTTGRRIVVRQSVDEVVDAVLKYQQAVTAGRADEPDGQRALRRPPLHLLQDRLASAEEANG